MNTKAIRALHDKKHRERTKKFLVEGKKNIQELLLSDLQIENLYTTASFAKEIQKEAQKKNVSIHTVDEGELTAMGTLERNDGGVAVVFQSEQIPPAPTTPLLLVLDEIRDPGNLGTLIRIADWYGLTHIVCSPNCVDWYNPKVISASMGSFTRVRQFVTDLPAYLQSYDGPKLGADLDGASVHSYAFPQRGILVIGSESHGISSAVAECLTGKVTIPAFGKAESLNAAIAGAIVIDRWKGSLAKE